MTEGTTEYIQGLTSIFLAAITTEAAMCRLIVIADRLVVRPHTLAEVVIAVVVVGEESRKSLDKNLPN